MDCADRESFLVAMRSPENKAVANDLITFAKRGVKVIVAETENT